MFLLRKEVVSEEELRMRKFLQKQYAWNIIIFYEKEQKNIAKLLKIRSKLSCYNWTELKSGKIKDTKIARIEQLTPSLSKIIQRKVF